MLSADQVEANKEFGDSDLATVTVLLRKQSEAYGLPSEFSKALTRLFNPRAEESFIPYLQILFYVATVDHFYDHPAEFIYVFKPRGFVANKIFSVFPKELAPGGNPMLNNLKAVDRLTTDWAESREDTREQAIALVTVVLGLSSLAYPARKQLSGLIRRGLIRFIEIETPDAIVLPRCEDLTQVERFLTKVAEVPTGTRGIIEQRVTDFLAGVIHRDKVWRSRGLGDAVNATNSSSRKLGDCDFQDAGQRVCHAVESHAGRLTDVYVAEHLRTLRLNLPARLDEWEGIADLSEWAVEIIFVAHEDARGDRETMIDLVVRGSLRVTTFDDLKGEIMGAAATSGNEIVALFNEWVVSVLNSPNTPHATKIIARQLFESTSGRGK